MKFEERNIKKQKQTRFCHPPKPPQPPRTLPPTEFYFFWNIIIQTCANLDFYFFKTFFWHQHLLKFGSKITCNFQSEMTMCLAYVVPRRPNQERRFYIINCWFLPTRLSNLTKRGPTNEKWFLSLQTGRHLFPFWPIVSWWSSQGRLKLINYSTNHGLAPQHDKNIIR